MTEGIGVAVIGAGMAGRSHAHAYRNAQTVFGTGAPAARLVAIADLSSEFATHTAQRYGFERAESSWQAIAEAGDIDAVSIVVANHLHREIAEGLLAAGKHVLCEKPLAPSVEDAQAMVAAAGKSGRVASCGFSYRRSPSVAAVTELARAGALGQLLPNDLAFEVFGTGAAARFDLSRNAEFGFVDAAPSPVTNGWRRVVTGPEHPYIAAGQSMPFAGVGHGGQEFFTYQARAFLDEISGLDRLPRQATFADGLRNLVVQRAVVEAAATGSAAQVTP